MCAGRFVEIPNAEVSALEERVTNGRGGHRGRGGHGGRGSTEQLKGSSFYVRSTERL